MLSPTSLESSLDRTIYALETPRMGMAYVNYLIAARVAADSKVVLSGTGGDEFHAGYIGRYQYLENGAAVVQPAHSVSAKLRVLAGKLVRRRGRGLLAWQERYRVLLNFPLQYTEAEAAMEPGFLERVDVEALMVSLADRLHAVEHLQPTEAMLQSSGADFVTPSI